MMTEPLNDDGCLRLLAAVILQWWREAEQVEEHDDLAAFLGMPEDEVRSVRPLRIDGWRRKKLTAQQADEGDDDVF